MRSPASTRPSIPQPATRTAVDAAQWVILAVKPWLVDSVAGDITFRPDHVVVSIAAGVTFEHLVEVLGDSRTIFRMIPNTAISELASMTLIASRNASPEQEQTVLSLFNELGLAMMIPESQMNAAMILTSCGIAYVLKYIHAATEAGVSRWALAPQAAMKMIAESVKGAAVADTQQRYPPCH